MVVQPLCSQVESRCLVDIYFEEILNRLVSRSCELEYSWFHSLNIINHCTITPQVGCRTNNEQVKRQFCRSRRGENSQEAMGTRAPSWFRQTEKNASSSRSMTTLSSRSRLIEIMAILLSLVLCLFFAAKSIFGADVQPQIPFISGDLDLIYVYVFEASKLNHRF
jgi:hypothetical protein